MAMVVAELLGKSGSPGNRDLRSWAGNNQPDRVKKRHRAFPLRAKSSAPSVETETDHGGCRIRSCLGCGTKLNKAELVRFGRVAGFLVVDTRQVLPGRGVYCCRNLQCLQRLLKQRKKLTWALRCHDRDKVGDIVISPGFEVEFATTFVASGLP